MKRLFTVFVTANYMFQPFSFAQGTWTQKANFGEIGRAGAVGFSIGTKGYVGTGVDATFNPTIGGEYIFGEHFSIGSEIGFPFAIANKDAAIGFGFNRLILRFYPKKSLKIK